MQRPSIQLRNWAVIFVFCLSAGFTVPQLVGSDALHPLDPALTIARDGLDRINKDVRDYTCTIVKRERVGGALGEVQFMSAKVRHRSESNGQQVPFSVYLKFLKPKSVEGREVIWIEGRNDGKLVAHETGLLNIKRVWLATDSYLAMSGQRYPIHQIGFRNLLDQLIVKGEKDRALGTCEVTMPGDPAKINNRACRMIQVVHPEKQRQFEFHKVQIFIDNELQIPVRYAAWTWPIKAGDEPVLEEEYTYLDVKLNVGLSDKDFDPDNKEYNFPRL